MRALKFCPVLMCLIAAVVLVGFVQLHAGEEAKTQMQGEAAQAKMEEQMAAMAKLGAPGDHHRHLQQMAGTWKADATFWMAPEAPPTKSTGTMKSEMILGGRFLKSDFAGDFMGSPFNGVAIDGYDNQAHKHMGLWMDSMGTSIISLEGSCEQGGKVQTMHTEFTDPMTGTLKKVKAMTTMQAPDRYLFEWWEAEGDGQMRKSMEIQYTKQG